jgi:hypothetical protein
LFACCYFYSRLYLLLIIIHTTCISLSLRRTSAPIHLTSVSGMLGTQETLCIIIAGLIERDCFDLFLPEFDKPWVIHLRETCCCSTNLCVGGPILSTRTDACVDIRRRSCGTVLGKTPIDLGFSIGRLLIGERASSGGDQGGLTIGGRG